MSKKTLLDAIYIPLPCPKSWEKMIGGDKVRFCESCENDIYNISAMTRQEARKLLFQSKEKVCIRMEKDSAGRIRTLGKKFHQISRQVSIAAGILSVSLTLSVITYAQNEKNAPDQIGEITVTQSARNKSATQKAVISGIVSNPNDAVIPGVKITLRDAKSGKIQTVISDAGGYFEFKDVETAVYQMEIEAVGFNKFIYQNFAVNENDSFRLDINLQPTLKTEVGTFAPPEEVIGTTDATLSNNITSRQLEDLPRPKLELVGPPRTPIFTPNQKIIAKKKSNLSQISFTIYDANGAIIRQAEVELTNQKTKQEFTISTNNGGIAQFNSIPHGLYEVKVSAPHFQSSQRRIQVKEPIEPNTKIILEIGTITGIVLIDWYEVPFFNAIAQNDIEPVKQIIASGFNVKTKDRGNRTALHVAVEHLNLEIVKLLLDAGAKVDAKDKSKHTPLLMIEDNFEENTAEIVRLLIAHGADVNAQSREGKSALMFACDEDNLEVVKILLEAGANVNFKNSDGETALNLASNEEIKKFAYFSRRTKINLTFFKRR